jgi:2-polyprenyl-3-methyl-5-hydroxy-6-metoxy-1,4-benzoquinol methylase
MSDDLNQNYMENNRKLWNEWVPIHVNSRFYNVDRFIEGANSLNALELGEMGDVEGKNLLHLQCHFGMDTLNWARLGAHVTGMDFSEAAIEQANQLAGRCNLDGRFICCNIYDLPQNLLGQYDIVYTSYGVLAWLPDIALWAKIAASYVKPGGFFYIAEFHPFAMVFDDDAANLQFRYPYFDKQPIKFDVEGSYADREAKIQTKEEIGWNYTLSDIVNSLIENGLQIEYIHEFPYSVYQQLPFLVPDGNGLYNFPDGQHPIPLMFSLKAIKR